METSLSEDVKISTADSELPDMVPVSIRCSLPEFQHHSLEKVLAGLLLTWEEFLQLFDIRLDPNEYFIRGTNGIKSGLTEKIGDYVNSLKRKMKTYPVTLERVNGTNDISRAHRLSTNSESSTLSVSKSNSDIQSSSAFPDEPGSLLGPTNKKFKLLDDDLRSKHHLRAKESLSKIAQNVMRSPGVKRSNHSIEKKRGSGSRSPSPTKDVDKIGRSADSASTRTPSDDVMMHHVNNVPSADVKVKRLSAEYRPIKDFAVNNTMSFKKTRKIKQKTRVGARRSTNDSRSIDVSDESSETDDDVVPCPKDKKKELKQSVIDYLTKKVSPRSMLRLRNELMALREQEKYFKVTSVVPMTAGMMEQTFCRKLSEH